LTGLYPHKSGVRAEGDILSGSVPTLGDTMRKRGYRTAAFSANFYFFARDLGFVHGFSRFEDYDQSIGGILEKVPLSKLVLTTLSRFTIGERWAFFGLKNVANGEKINENAMNWIEKGHRPFFAVLNYFDLHEPVLPPDSFLHEYNKNEDARAESLDYPEMCALFGRTRSCDPERPQFIDSYDGAMHYVDQNIQQLLSQLKERGILDDTIVVITGDHGQEFGDHGIYGHGKSLFRGEIHVPLLFFKPGMVPAAVRVPTPVSTIDIAATILDLTAPDGKQALPGRSLAPLWHSNDVATGWPEPISELAKLHWFVENAPNYNGPVQSIVTPDWHYIHQEGKDLLFDWKTDIDEAHDLCAAQPAACATLKTQVQADQGSRQQAH
jgi:arylsulfatase A-like enzyme